METDEEGGGGGWKKKERTGDKEKKIPSSMSIDRSIPEEKFCLLACSLAIVRDKTMDSIIEMVFFFFLFYRIERAQKRRDRKWKAGSPFGGTQIRRRATAIR